MHYVIICYNMCCMIVSCCQFLHLAATTSGGKRPRKPCQESELHKVRAYRETGHGALSVRKSNVSAPCPVVICPYLCTSEIILIQDSIFGTSLFVSGNFAPWNLTSAARVESRIFPSLSAFCYYYHYYYY